MQTTDTPTRKPPHWVRKIQTRFQHGDWLWRALTILMGLLVLALILSIGYMLWYDSLDAQSQLGIKFFLPSADSSWDPVDGVFQAWPFIYGTLITALVAIVVALPIGLFVAVFLAELCPAWLKTPLGTVTKRLSQAYLMLRGFLRTDNGAEVNL